MLHPYSNSDVGAVSLMNSDLRLVRSARIFAGELKCKMLGPRATDISASIIGEKRPSDPDGWSATLPLQDWGRVARRSGAIENDLASPGKSLRQNGLIS